MPESPAQQFVWATDTTWVTELVLLKKGEPWPADDPIVRRFKDNFTTVPPEDVVQRSSRV
jgi:hypothetical protein